MLRVRVRVRARVRVRVRVTVRVRVMRGGGWVSGWVFCGDVGTLDCTWRCDSNCSNRYSGTTTAVFGMENSPFRFPIA